MSWILDNLLSILALLVSAGVGIGQLLNWRKEFVLKQRATTLEEQTRGSSAALDEAEASIKIAQHYRTEMERAQKLVDELLPYKAKLEEVQLRLKELEDWKSKAQAQQVENVQTIQALRRLLAGLQTENDTLRQEVDGLRREVQRMESENAQLKAQVNKLPGTGPLGAEK